MVRVVGETSYLLRCAFEGECFWFACCGYSYISSVKHFLNEMVAETGRGTGYEEDSRHDVWDCVDGSSLWSVYVTELLKSPTFKGVKSGRGVHF